MEGIFLTVIVIATYFLPWIVAHQRCHHNENSIALLNLFLGWTVIGWLAAIIWSASEVRQESSTNKTAAASAEPAPTPETHVKCPDCAELVRKEAKICKHCGCKLVPQ